jgi:hypothetical protein
MTTINLDNYCYDKDMKPVRFVLTWPLLEFVFYLYIDRLTVTMI